MTNNPSRLRILMEAYTADTISSNELDELCRLVKENELELQQLFEYDLAQEPFTSMDQLRLERMLQEILTKEDNEAERVSGEEERADSRESLVVSPSTPAIGGTGALRIKLWKRIAVAASIAGVVFVSYWLMKDKTTVDSPQTTGIQTSDVKAPDKNRAQIKLADGRIVYLDSAANGELVDVNGVKVMKTGDGRIEYSRESGIVSGELKYNTLINPRGSKVMDMTLADGSRVWLNAGSSVTYPIVFIGKERNVTITGEAYFEVAHNAVKPFKVSKGEMEVTVLGTHFNVNAYDDESEIKVTLLEGSVNVSRGPSTSSGSVVRLKPGQQAKAMGNGQLAISKNVELEEVMAWKNGKFVFGEKADIKTIMRQIARWYDVTVEYKGNVNGFIGGSISRNVNVSNVLKMLEKTGEVKFIIEGNKITVLP